MFWKKKEPLKSDEYRELKQQIDLLWLELDIMSRRYKRKVLNKETPEETKGFNDGFDDLRQLNKDHPI